MKMFGNSVNVQPELFNLTLFYGFPSFPFTRLTMWKEGLQLLGLKLYCNGLDQRVARQPLCKHGPTRNSGGSCVLRVRGDVTQQWIETT
jgi:hypothetical protein